jgi:hypothetical protein
MPPNFAKETLPLVAPSLTILEIGVWADDPANDCLRGDAVMARLYEIPEDEMAQGISWTRLAALFHPDDLARGDTEQRRWTRGNGGLFLWEHRIVPASGTVRWVLARGHFARDADGRMRGSGIIVDLTDTRAEGVADEPPSFLLMHEPFSSPVERMANHAIQIWQMANDLDPAGEVRVRPLIRALMYELGCQIAAAVRGAPPGRATH